MSTESQQVELPGASVSHISAPRLQQGFKRQQYVPGGYYSLQRVFLSLYLPVPKGHFKSRLVEALLPSNVLGEMSAT